jgi:hypothetical protein
LPKTGDHEVSLKNLCENLETKIKNSYEAGVTMEEAERLASEFLHAQLQVSGELRKADLDSRMKKSGVKAIRAAVYLNAIKSTDRKPTEAALSSMIDSDDIVTTEQQALDEAEVERDELKRIYDVFGNAHIHFRGIAKGSFGG